MPGTLAVHVNVLFEVLHPVAVLFTLTTVGVPFCFEPLTDVSWNDTDCVPLGASNIGRRAVLVASVSGTVIVNFTVEAGATVLVGCGMGLPVVPPPPQPAAMVRPASAALA